MEKFQQLVEAANKALLAKEYNEAHSLFTQAYAIKQDAEVGIKLNKCVVEIDDLKYAHHIGKLSDEALEKLRKQHGLNEGDISHISVAVSKDTKVHGYFKPSNKMTAARALSLYHQDKILEAGETLLINNFIGGDENIKTNDILNISFSNILRESDMFFVGSLEKV